MVKYIILAIIAFWASRSWVDRPVPQYRPNTNISSGRRELAQKLVDMKMSSRPESFKIANGWIDVCDNKTFFDRLGYKDLSKWKCMELARIMVLIAKEKYPQEDWKISVHYMRTENPLIIEFSEVQVNLVTKSKAKLKRF